MGGMGVAPTWHARVSQEVPGKAYEHILGEFSFNTDVFLNCPPDFDISPGDILRPVDKLKAVAVIGQGGHHLGAAEAKVQRVIKLETSAVQVLVVDCTMDPVRGKGGRPIFGVLAPGQYLIRVARG